MAKESSDSSVYVLPFERSIAKLARQIEELQASQTGSGRDISAEIRRLRAEHVSLLKKTYSALSPWETVQVARHPNRPLAGDYIDNIVKDFTLLQGDRLFGEDRSIRCGFGRIGPEKVALIAQHKGRDTRERIACNFGCPMPEGYRKALRMMKLAEKYHLPVVTIIDTPGAFPGVESEERGVAEAIARNLLEMSRLKTPILCLVIGEGGSGGALGIGVGDRVAIMEYAYYSVISPEGCAAILWKSGEQAPEAAEAMKLTARKLKELDIVDAIVPEPLGGAHRNPAEAFSNVERFITGTLRELKRVSQETLLEHRYRRWRRMGRVERLAAEQAAAVG
jgi:acetyl-CoA carboxylase carboxyl transferase subunit alpha